MPQYMESSLKSKTAKGLLWGGMSNVLQQLLNAFFGIFLARMLSESDYGMIGMLTVFILVANSLQECGFTNALVNRTEFKSNDYNAVFWFSVLMGLGLYVVLFLVAPFVAKFYNQPDLQPLLRYLSLSFVFSSTATAHNAMMFKRLMVKQKSISQISALIVSGTIGLIMACNGMAYWGLATQTVTYTFVYASLMWTFSPWCPKFHFDLSPIKSMFGFSSKMLITNIFQQVNNNIFSVLLGRLYSAGTVGFYTQANKWESMLHNTISGMLTGVAQPVLHEVDGDTERQRNVFRKMLRFTAFISFPAMFGFALIAKEFIVITVTAKWLNCVPMLQLLCVWGAFQPITLLYTNMVISKGRSNIYMYNNIAIGLVQLVVLILINPLGIKAMIIAFIVINVGWLLVWQYFVSKYIKLSLRQALSDVVPFMAISLATMTACHYATCAIENIYVLLPIRIILAVAIYAATMKITKAEIFNECITYLKKIKSKSK